VPTHDTYLLADPSEPGCHSQHRPVVDRIAFDSPAAGVSPVRNGMFLFCLCPVTSRRLSMWAGYNLLACCCLISFFTVGRIGFVWDCSAGVCRLPGVRQQLLGMGSTGHHCSGMSARGVALLFADRVAMDASGEDIYSFAWSEGAVRFCRGVRSPRRSACLAPLVLGMAPFLCQPSWLGWVRAVHVTANQLAGGLGADSSTEALPI